MVMDRIHMRETRWGYIKTAPRVEPTR